MENGVIYRRTVPLSDPRCQYPGFRPGKQVLKKGTVCKPGHAPLQSDILVERDVAIPVRDGTILYADIFRPTGEEKVPAMLNSTPFGKAKKEPSGETPGVDPALTSGLETFEGTDPGFYVSHGYAIVNLDIRGCYMSEGDSPYFGPLEAQDDYDVIEWLASQDWCSGKVTMTGNSWLGIVQWFAGALCPPHLCCLAPWEGWSDMYRDEYMVGGIANYPGFRFNNAYHDDGWMEDVVANCAAHPLFDEYWETKAAEVEKITVPVYCTSSYTSPVHCKGTLSAWRRLRGEKWLRIHNLQEWGDTAARRDELLLFLDYFMKGKTDNGFDSLPRVRVSVLDPGRGEDITDRPEEDFPLPRQELRSLYLNAETMALEESVPAEEASVSYNAIDGKSRVRFTTFFEQETEIVGYINTVLWVESAGFNDMDLYVRLTKISAEGNTLYHYAVPTMPEFDEGVYCGPGNRQRVSLRELDPVRSTENEPYHTFRTVQKLRPHEIVPVEIGLYPTGLRLHPGEGLMLEIGGFPFINLPGTPQEQALFPIRIDSVNNGLHVIHTGGATPSRVVIPFIPIEKD